MSFSEIIGPWFIVFFTLCIFSFLYGDNPFYKISEHIFVGVSAGYVFARVYWDTIWPNLFGRLFPSYVDRGFDLELIYIIPLIFGIFMLLRLSSKLSWLSRLAIAYIVGMAAGLKFYKLLNSNILKQVEASILDLSLPMYDIINQVIILVGVISSLVYFFYSKEHKGVIGKISRIGVYFLMIKFGASFGFAVMGRISLLIGRFEDLIKYSGSQYGYSTPIILLFMVAVLGYWSFKQKNNFKEKNKEVA